MIAAFDVHYWDDDQANAAAVLFHRYTDSAPTAVLTRLVPIEAGYVPGSFYRRELPCILALAGQIDTPLDEIVIDGYAWLGKRPGLGQHLYEALSRKTPVIGVAKSGFRSALGEPLYRGRSRRPLYITAAGMPVTEAVDKVRDMHGNHRIPTLLKKVDLLARGKVATDAQ